jgi:hypothetical protein
MSASSHLELLSGRPFIGSSPLDLASVLSKATPEPVGLRHDARLPSCAPSHSLDGEPVVTGEDGISSARPIGPGGLGTGSRSRTPTARRWCAAIRLVQTADGRTSPFVERGSELPPPNPGAAKVLTRIRSPAPPGPPLSGGSDGGITYGYSIDPKLRSEPSGDQECTRVRSAR